MYGACRYHTAQVPTSGSSGLGSLRRGDWSGKAVGGCHFRDLPVQFFPGKYMEIWFPIISGEICFSGEAGGGMNRPPAISRSTTTCQQPIKTISSNASTSTIDRAEATSSTNATASTIETPEALGLQPPAPQEAGTQKTISLAHSWREALKVLRKKVRFLLLAVSEYRKVVENFYSFPWSIYCFPWRQASKEYCLNTGWTE